MLWAMLRFLFSLVVVSLLVQCTKVPPAPAPKLPLPEGFCYVDEVVPSARVELLYASDYNFVGKKLAGYEGKRAILRRDAAEGLARAAALLKPKGLGILITDAYRPRRAMEDVQEWAQNDDDRMRSHFYPNITKKEVFEHRYIGTVSEHSWGVAVDLTLVRLSTGAELDMGGYPDLLDAISATDYDGPELTVEQRVNRQLLKSAMEEAGFKNYSKEWWHYWIVSDRKPLSYDFVIEDDLPPAP